MKRYNGMLQPAYICRLKSCGQMQYIWLNYTHLQTVSMSIFTLLYRAKYDLKVINKSWLVITPIIHFLLYLQQFSFWIWLILGLGSLMFLIHGKWGQYQPETRNGNMYRTQKNGLLTMVGQEKLNHISYKFRFMHLNQFCLILLWLDARRNRLIKFPLQSGFSLPRSVDLHTWAVICGTPHPSIIWPHCGGPYEILTDEHALIPLMCQIFNK